MLALLGLVWLGRHSSRSRTYRHALKKKYFPPWCLQAGEREAIWEGGGQSSLQCHQPQVTLKRKAAIDYVSNSTNNRSCTDNLKKVSSSSSATVDTGDCLDKTFRQLKVKPSVWKRSWRKSCTRRWRRLGWRAWGAGRMSRRRKQTRSNRQTHLLGGINPHLGKLIL